MSSAADHGAGGGAGVFGTLRPAPLASPPPAVVQYAVTLGLVALATLLAFVAAQAVTAPNLTLIFVLPVVIAAVGFGWRPALVATAAGLAAFDFFFTAPYFNFRIDNSTDLWAAGLLLATAAIVSTVAAQSRRRALDARDAADQAQALQGLAHMVIEGRPQGEVEAAAAATLARVFRAPAVVFAEEAGVLRASTVAGGGQAGPVELDAARAALEARSHIAGETYPYGESRLDLWPVVTPSGARYVLGVDFARPHAERPVHPERHVELVGACLAGVSR